MSHRRSPSAQFPRPSLRWAVGLLAVMVGYALLQPFVARQFGWQWPSLPELARMAGEQADAGASGNWERSDTGASAAPAGQGNDAGTPSPNAGENAPADRSPYSIEGDTPGSAATERTTTQPRGPPAEPPRYGYLKEIGPEDFLSPAGLRYTRGSQEGHRLKHLAKHLKDQPDRPGSHGVFEADMPQVLRWLDEVFQRAQREEPGTSRRQERDRWVLEAAFDEAVGYVGGSTGARRGHPETRQIRLVVEDNRVITAFPF